MRPVLALSLLSALVLRICGSDPPPAAPPTAVTPEAPPATAVVSGTVAAGPVGVPHHGGAVVAIGAHAVEVLEKADGKVEGYISDADGNVPPPATMALSIDVPGVDVQTHLVAMTWNPATLRYEGSLGVAPARGPIEVHLGVDGAPPQIVELVGVPIESGLRLSPALIAGMRAQAGLSPQPEAQGRPQAEVQAGVTVTGPSVGVVVVPPVYEPPPPPNVQFGVGVNFGGGGVVRVEEDDDGDHDHGHHGEHGHHEH